MRKSISKYLFFIGIGFFIISYLLPVDFFENFTNLRPTGLTSMIVCPIIGLIGLIFEIKDKDKLFIILNLLLILLLPIAMFVDHLV
ncbi:hypothetical protein PEPCOX59622_01088 [Aedoeadaptatus coxii]|uniref:hypothetical protein n=1 Tax=Aedoeadaptatus coxii TaxID=755172 RepID=UPI00177483A2|nr:hypothetical protein [Peptoniphilus coxii]CAC9932548.1 hypothetical protein PEPCOX59622_01088 [Peptoniphilus coxii]